MLALYQSGQRCKLMAAAQILCGSLGQHKAVGLLWRCLLTCPPETYTRRQLVSHFANGSRLIITMLQVHWQGNAVNSAGQDSWYPETIWMCPATLCRVCGLCAAVWSASYHHLGILFVQRLVFVVMLPLHVGRLDSHVHVYDVTALVTSLLQNQEVLKPFFTGACRSTCSSGGS